MRRTPTERVMVALLAAAAAEFVVLAVTGLYLVFFYRPSAAQAWGAPGRHPAGLRLVEIVRIGHRLTSATMILTVIAAAVVGLTPAAARSRAARGHRTTAAGAVGVAVVGLFASFTGFLLPWDQLALRAVTTGVSMMGFLPIFGSRVRYVLIGGSTVSLGTLRLWMLVHVAAVPALLVVLGLLAAQRLLQGQDRPDRRTDGHTGLGS